MEEIKIKLQKGNLFNSLTGYFDFQLLNSSEYDLEISRGEEKEYFRVRLIDLQYVVTKIQNLTHYEFYKPKGESACSKKEIMEFIQSDFYKYEYPHKKDLDAFAKTGAERKYESKESYSNFLHHKVLQNSFKAQPIYSFFLPATNWNPRKGLIGYHVSIENVKNRYFIVFADCIMQKGFEVENPVPLWSIYDRKNFIEEQKNFEDAVLSLSIEKDIPLLLTQAIFLFTNQNVSLTEAIIKQINKYKQYFQTTNLQKFLQKDFSKKDPLSMQHSLSKILGVEFYQNLGFCLEKEEQFSRAIIDYILEDREDIQYSISSKKLIKTIDERNKKQ